MVMGVRQSVALITVLPNLFVVGDTVTRIPNLESVIEAVSSLADHIQTKR